VAGLRSTGLVAPLVLDGPMNGPAFLAYVKQFLAPTLQPGDVVVMMENSVESSRELHLPWLDGQWAAGKRNGADLWRRLNLLGFRGLERLVGE
jgi:transposase